LIATSLIAALAGGCSADVARFDFPGLGINGGDVATPPRPNAPMRSGSKSLIDQGPAGAADATPGAYVPPPPRDSGVKVAALPEPLPASPPLQSSPAQSPPAQNAPASSSPLQPEPRRAPPAFVSGSSNGAEATAAAQGQTIEVQSGDTLYGLSKKHKVSVSELMSANGLKGPALKPGQKLVLPSGGRGPMKPGTRIPGTDEVAVRTGIVPASKAVPRAANWDGAYTVKPGDSLYTIARQHRVAQNELQQVNGIADPLKVRPGTILKVPAAGGAAGAAVASAPVRPGPVTSPAPAAPVPLAAVAEATAPRPAADEAPRVIQSTTQPTIINGERKVAALTDKQTDAGPPASAAAPTAPPAEAAPAPSKGEQTAAAGGAALAGGKLRWPAKGKIIASFGPRTDGTHNDGVNVAVPMGTEVHAAEAGTVAYAGSELKGYGNLVLIRHDNGWVTAYAHNEELLVKRGDRIKRGQVVAKAGKTGQVDQPQVHFELRQGAKPVDPTPFMERM